MNPKMIQILDANGNCKEADITGLSGEDKINMYRLMLVSRLWDEKALSLQRQGRLGTFASIRGQEASNIGMALPLEESDWFIPAFREHGALFAVGIPLRDQFLYWGGDERGAIMPNDLRVTNICITVGSHLCHAVGIALASKIKGEKNATLSSSGDGSTSEGDFHESLNMAAVFNAPVVFVIQNNQWAISLPFEKQTATETIAEKAAAYAIEGVRVDGNDVFAVYTTVKKYLDRARKDSKPALIELVTYRMSDHTTADDASRYRTKEILAEWEKKDPIERLKKYLINNKELNEKQEAKIQSECAQEVETAVKQYEKTEPRNPSSMFSHIYATMPWHLQEEMEEVKTLYQQERAD